MRTSISVDVDIEDILWEMSEREKEELCKELIKDGYGPDKESVGYLGETTTESRLVNILDCIWQNRTNLQWLDLDELENTLKEKNIIQ
jgi:hypothetical protein